MSRIFIAFAMLTAIVCAPVVSYSSNGAETVKTEWKADVSHGEQLAEIVFVNSFDQTFQEADFVFNEIYGYTLKGMLEVPLLWPDRIVRLPAENNHMHNKAIKASRQLANLIRYDYMFKNGSTGKLNCFLC